MMGLWQDETDPAWNLATEEYLLGHVEEPCFLVWRNDKAVVIGRNQNALAEVHKTFVDRNGIPVLRRLSGGGAVFHDLGNVNFTYIEPQRVSRRRSYGDFMSPVLDFLRHMGVPAWMDARSDLAVHGRKISGNAQCRRGGTILHHGTLLFDTDLDLLRAALHASPSCYKDKAVRSVRRPVTNIRRFLNDDMAPERFAERLMAYMQRLLGFRRVALTDEDRQAVSELARTKYRTWEWNYAASPPYRFEKYGDGPHGPWRVCLDVVRGVIQKAHVESPTWPDGRKRRLERDLLECPHEPASILAVIRSQGETAWPELGNGEGLLDLFL